MPTREIEPSVWRDYFELVTKQGRGQQVRVEIVGDEIGDQIEREWSPFEGMSYSHLEKTVYLHLRPLSHAIPTPQKIFTEENGSLHSILIEDEEGNLHILHFRESLMLESPSTA